MSIESVQLRIAAISQFAGVPRSASPARATASFDRALQDALGASETGSVTAAGVPTDLARYGNGRIPANALVQVGQTGHRMWAPAATALTRLIDDAARAGVAIGVTDSYRSYDSQVQVAQEKGLYRNGGLAATPGTSTHGWGRSADLDLSPRALAWMREHGSKYGFVADVPRESWHWTYSPSP